MWFIQKDILFCDLGVGMDKYLLVILMFMIAGMIIALTRATFEFGLFYASAWWRYNYNHLRIYKKQKRAQ